MTAQDEAPPFSYRPPNSNLQSDGDYDGKSKVSMQLSNSHLYKWHFLLFMCMGSGANWVFATALAQEIPYFQSHQPEGLCIATYMNASTNFGLLTLTTYVYIYENFYQIPYHVSVPILLSISTLGCILAASLYSVTVDGVSLVLFVCCAIGGTVGALASVIMSPFLMKFENDFISAARSGGSALILLTAVMSAIQSPGGSPRFSVAAYMSIFAVLLAMPLIAYYNIVNNNIGLRKEVVTLELSKQDRSTLHDVINSMSESQRHDSRDNESKRSPDDVENPLYKSSIDASSSSHLSASAVDEKPQQSMDLNHELEDEALLTNTSNDPIDQMVFNLVMMIIPKSVAVKYPWLVRVLPYMLAIAWIDFNTWGCITAALPFAIAANSPGDDDGSSNLAIAYEIGSFCLVSGDLTTTLFQLPYRYAVTLYTVFAVVIYVAAFNLPGFYSPAAAPFIVILYALTQYIEAHTLTAAYRICATKFPVRYREAASRAVGIADQIGTALGAILSTVLISKIGNC